MSELLCASDGDPAFEETRGEMKRLLRLTKAGTATVTYGPVPQRLLPDIIFHFLLEVQTCIKCFILCGFYTVSVLRCLSNVPFAFGAQIQSRKTL